MVKVRDVQQCTQGRAYEEVAVLLARAFDATVVRHFAHDSAVVRIYGAAVTPEGDELLVEVRREIRAQLLKLANVHGVETGGVEVFV